MNRELLQQALDALKNGRNVRQGMGSIKLQISFENEAIAKLEQELAKPQNEFNPDWNQIKPYHDRIAELEAQLALEKKANNARELGLGYEPVAYWNRKDGFICADQVQYVSIWSDYYPEPLYSLQTVSADNSMQAVDHGFDRTASHIAGEYMDTKHQNVNTFEERVHKSDKNVHEPVAWMRDDFMPHDTLFGKYSPMQCYDSDIPLYTTQPITDYREGWEEGYKAGREEIKS